MKAVRMKLALAVCLSLFPAVCVAQDWHALGLDNGSLSCKDQIVLKSFMHDGFYKGLALVSLKTGAIKWEAIPNESTVMRPMVAGDVVAVVTPHSHKISAFAVSTGQPLWRKESDTEILDSDGKYFYVLSIRPVVEAVDPKTGRTIWSRKVPYSGYLTYSYHPRDNHLYTDEFVLDVAKRKVAHRWPAKPLIDAMAFDESRRIYLGDPDGLVRIFSPSFKLLKEIQVARGEIVELGAAANGLVAASYEYFHGTYRVGFKVLTQEGKTKWKIAAHSQGTLGGPEFVIAGQEVILIEPEPNGEKYWLTSRELSTGRINWRTHPGSYPDYLGSSIAVCGETLYISDLTTIYSFDLHTGAEKVVARNPQ